MFVLKISGDGASNRCPQKDALLSKISLPMAPQVFLWILWFRRRQAGGREWTLVSRDSTFKARSHPGCRQPSPSADSLDAAVAAVDNCRQSNQTRAITWKRLLRRDVDIPEI